MCARVPSFESDIINWSALGVVGIGLQARRPYPPARLPARQGNHSTHGHFINLLMTT